MVDSRLVYSDDPNFKKLCKKCEKHPCACVVPQAQVVPKDHTLKLRIEKNYRGGKTVVVISHLPSNDAYCEELSRKIKMFCGCGGTYKNQQIEIQGNNLEKVRAKLTELGFKVRG